MSGIFSHAKAFFIFCAILCSVQGKNISYFLISFTLFPFSPKRREPWLKLWTGFSETWPDGYLQAVTLFLKTTTPFFIFGEKKFRPNTSFVASHIY